MSFIADDSPPFDPKASLGLSGTGIVCVRRCVLGANNVVGRNYDIKLAEGLWILETLGAMVDMNT